MSLNFDPISQQETAEALEQIKNGLERALAGVTALATAIQGEEPSAADLDTKNPKNKYEIGGLEKLTPRGAEICYRLFDLGKTRYAVAADMGISFGAATHRYEAWKKAGGLKRNKANLE